MAKFQKATQQPPQPEDSHCRRTRAWPNLQLPQRAWRPWRPQLSLEAPETVLHQHGMQALQILCDAVEPFADHPPRLVRSSVCYWEERDSE